MTELLVLTTFSPSMYSDKLLSFIAASFVKCCSDKWLIWDFCKSETYTKFSLALVIQKYRKHPQLTEWRKMNVAMMVKRIKNLLNRPWRRLQGLLQLPRMKAGAGPGGWRTISGSYRITSPPLVAHAGTSAPSLSLTWAPGGAPPAAWSLQTPLCSLGLWLWESVTSPPGGGG